MTCENHPLPPRSLGEFGTGDTVCIDKTSSAELTEAINSMFEWYHAAEVCYAYLADVSSVEVDRYDFNSPFRQSRWFTRGWTLQELLAPATVVFLNQDWVEIGTKSSLAHVISAITRISRRDMIDFKNANIAVKMSWASSRETTRVEDTAYCLLGLFGVNMPLLYGEGRNAFIRLQLEILSKSDDETIFAWEGTSRMDTGLLASSPVEFSKSGNIRRVLWDGDRPEYSMTNRGLRMELTLLQQKNGSHEWDMDGKMYLAPLNCTRDPKGYPIAIFLKQVAAERNSVGSKFIRCLSRPGASLIMLPISKGPPADTLKQECFMRVVNGSAYSYDPRHPSTSAGVVYSVRRSTVYVKQLDNDPGHNLVYRPRRFAISYPPSLFGVSEVRIRSGLAGWEEGEEPGECAVWLDTADEVAVVVFNVFSDKDVQFMLLLRRLRDDSARAGLWAVRETPEHIKTWTLRSLLRLSSADRTSAGLILAAVRPRAVSGEKQFLVDVSFGEQNYLRWYLSTEDQETMYDNDQLEKLVDQIQAYTPLRPSSQI